MFFVVRFKHQIKCIAMSVAPIIIPSVTAHTSTFFFFHGLGDTGHGWSITLKELRPAGMKLICPTAPTMSVTLNAGASMPSWFDLFGLEMDTKEDELGIKLAASKVHDMITAEVQKGIPTNRIVLGGFSQGGALALVSALTYQQSLAGVIALSCWLPMHKQFPQLKTCSSDLPIFLAHGDADSIISLSIAQRTSEALKSFMTNVTFKIYSDLEHTSSRAELHVVKSFLNKWTIY